MEKEKECVGCESKDLTRCDKTMCEKCWSAETEEPNQ